jgi:serine/threonine-protein phosphatase 2B regulatory subunit
MFKEISAKESDDGYIDKKEFMQALDLQDSIFVDRLFSLFLKEFSDKISFEEYLMGLHTFSPNAPLKDKIDCKC